MNAVGDPLTEQVIGAAIEVHRHLGPGLLEKISEEALCIEFALRGIPFDRQVAFDVVYKGRVIRGQRLDLLAFGEVVISLKSVRQGQEYFLAQLLSELKAAHLRRGLVINFGLAQLVDGIQRVSL
ncbi:MAG TPA: GxxExxY protein [Planctomycetota bacterium]|nr:GxxExxY protein [Planctomycetota bacterium]